MLSSIIQETKVKYATDRRRARRIVIRALSRQERIITKGVIVVRDKVRDVISRALNSCKNSYSYSQ